MTAAVDRLAARGLVRREDDAHDRRACIVHLTAAGRRLIERAFAQHRAEMEEALAGFAVEERRALLPLLRRLGRMAEESAAKAETPMKSSSSEMVKEALPDIETGARRSRK